MSEEKLYINWPIRIRLYTGIGCWRRWFHYHSCEAAHDMFNNRTFYSWTYHLGPVKMMFGYEWERPLVELFNAGMRVANLDSENCNSNEVTSEEE